MKYKDLYSDNAAGPYLYFIFLGVFALLFILLRSFTDNQDFSLLISLASSVLLIYCIDRYVYYRDNTMHEYKL